MTQSTTQRWLEAWGYSNSLGGLYQCGASAPATYAYRNEVEELLDPRGIIQATAVFDVDGVPSICFLEDNGRFANNSIALDRIREKIWNQNLISIVLVVRENNALAAPVNRRDLKGVVLPWKDASETGCYSRRDVQSGETFRRHTDWFAPESRVDRDLLRNLYRIVQDLERYGLKKVDAQYLMAQILFVSYLEHREIVGETYRGKHGLGYLEDLVRTGDRAGIVKLLTQLKHDFNGDFLEPVTNGSSVWNTLSNKAFSRLTEFMSRVDLETGQQNLWHYDFRYIPVELISGIYESFLSDEQRDVGAYYTPRHLANLVVDRAFAETEDILAERIYDGACGSGILLTTAYRRMLAYAEATRERPLRFAERSKLLEEHIFGSDINVSACRVTVFSLYLSMLEGLQPADIAELQENEDVKFPTLGEKNILGGYETGDFFSEKNALASAGKFTIFLSNPPWVEPKKDRLLSSDIWTQRNGFQIPRRQTAGAFMLRAGDCLAPGGRVCLILPISVIAAPTSSSFFKSWFDRYRVEALINFGDLRKLLFNTAKQPCVVAIAKPRSKETIGHIPRDETFEYWVPKADVSFAFGRLTLHSSDRYNLQTQVVHHDNEFLTALFWGTARDVATIADLRLQGTLDDLFNGDNSWSMRKGFHKQDTSIVAPVSSQPLHKWEYLDARRFDTDGPLLDSQVLSKFPMNIESVARLPEDLMEAFEGPKIVFTDGITKHRSVRAAFSNKVFSFSSSIGVITGLKDDESLLRFVAAYLHSSLARYVLLLTAYQINFERERVTLKDIRQLPFVHPDRHTNPMRAWDIVRAVANRTCIHEQQSAVLFSQPYNPEDDDPLFFEYFDLGAREQARVLEVASEIAPNLQPSSVAGLDTPLQRRPDQPHLVGYTEALRSEILAWQKARGGTGDVSIKLNINSITTCGPLGIVQVEPSIGGQDDGSVGHVTASDLAVNSLLQRLCRDRLFPLAVHNNLHLATDVVIREGETVYLVKPLVTRFWLRSEAYRDAERIVRHVLKTNFGTETKQ